MIIVKKDSLKIVVLTAIAIIIAYFALSNIKTKNEILYHGSPVKLTSLTPIYSERWDSSTRTWHGQGVLANNDRRVALIYTASVDEEHTIGVDLINMTEKDKPLTLIVFGGKSKDDAMDHLYGDSHAGYIYHLDHEGFKHETGLGKMQVVSRTTPRIQKIEVVNRKAEISKYVDQGLVKIEWQQLSKGL